MSDVPEAKFFKSGDPVFVRAQQVWIILVSEIMGRRESAGSDGVTITYGDLSRKMGKAKVPPVSLGKHTGIIAHYCIENDLPPLNIIAVNQKTGLPGYGVLGTTDRHFERDMKKVMEYDWFSVRVPTTGMLRKTWESLKEEY